MKAEDYVKQLLPFNSRPSLLSATAFASSNIALCKYWGKRDHALNLPVTSSLSMSLGGKGTETTLTLSPINEPEIIVNQQKIHNSTSMAQRLWRFMDLCMPQKKEYLRICTESNIPLAAGLASSASFFASLVLALNAFFHWQLTEKKLSLLARLASGSACRSFWPGFVEWQVGKEDSGMDSYAYPLDIKWPTLCMGLLLFSHQPKQISSSEAMNVTVDTSPLYKLWPSTVEEHLSLIKEALKHKDFHLLGSTVEANALAMHATMAASTPSIEYSLPITKTYHKKIKLLREEGIPVYFTQDAGPNIKVLFEKSWTEAIFRALGPMEVVEFGSSGDRMDSKKEELC